MIKPSDLIRRIWKGDAIADGGMLADLGRELDRLHGEVDRLRATLRDLLEARAYNDWTPTLVQSATVAATVNRARYQVDGQRVHVEAFVTATAAGTAGNAIQLTGLPKIRTSGSDMDVGVFHVITATTHYSGAAYVEAGATSVRGFASGMGGAIGFAPSFALAIGDRVTVNLTYEYQP